MNGFTMYIVQLSSPKKTPNDDEIGSPRWPSSRRPGKARRTAALDWNFTLRELDRLGMFGRKSKARDHEFETI